LPVIYDNETFPNVFTLSALGCDSDHAASWEISERRDDRDSLLAWLRHLTKNQIEMVGFDNIGFDYPIIHLLMCQPSASYQDLYAKAQSIIHSGDRFAHVIWDRDQIIPQLDLYKIHHFDNVARATGLKALQFNMRSASVEDLPFKPGTHLTFDEMDVLLDYNRHDVTETKAFYNHTRDQIQFRREISVRYGRDFRNHNDTKIGKDYFVMRLEQARPGSCFTGQPRRPVQTYRSEIRLSDIILPYVTFRHPEFIRIHAWLRQQVITETKGVLTDINCTINDFTFRFGTGGIHGSVTRQHVMADDQYLLIDLDVTSYYPNITIMNKLYPAHLGELFVDIYSDVMAQRQEYKKGTPENQMLKLALNGVYGDSNNPYSPFYDPQYMMAVTVNGQLLLCMLAEDLMLTVPGLSMIQINTDGLTVRVPRHHEWLVTQACDRWQRITRLNLERGDYERMYIRDVNNYLAVGTDGKIKRKGAYENAPPGKRAPLGWYQDTSALVVPKAAEAVLLTGADPEQWVRRQTDAFDFMLRAKVNRGSQLKHGDDAVQSTTRYYVTTNGKPLVKVSPPTGTIGHFKEGNHASDAQYRATDNSVWNADVHTKNRSVHKERQMQICAGYLTTICNQAAAFDWCNVNYDWYVAEVRKLLE